MIDVDLNCYSFCYCIVIVIMSISLTTRRIIQIQKSKDYITIISQPTYSIKISVTYISFSENFIVNYCNQRKKNLILSLTNNHGAEF